MKAIVIRGRKSEQELREYIENVKRVYKPDETAVVADMKEAAGNVAKDIREF